MLFAQVAGPSEIPLSCTQNGLSTEKHETSARRTGAAETQTGSSLVQFRDGFLKHWQVERDYVLAVAEAMPAGDYSFRPHAACWTFSEQLAHMAWANTLYFSSFDTLPPPARPTASDKETVRQYVAACFDYVTEVLNKLSKDDLLRNDLGAPQVKPHTSVDVCLRAYTHGAPPRPSHRLPAIEGYRPAHLGIPADRVESQCKIGSPGQ